MKHSYIKVTLSALMLFVSAGESLAAPTPYYAIVDAGSGGSRVYLYNLNPCSRPLMFAISH